MPVVSVVLLSALALAPSVAQGAARTVARCDAARLDRTAGVARSLSDCGRVDMARGAEGAARQALRRLSGALGVRSDARELRLIGVSPTSAGPRVRFQQLVEGVPVRNGQLAVALGNDGSVTRVGNGGVAATRLDTRARTSRAAALLTARRRVPSGFDLVAAPTTTLVAEPRARGGLELAWLVFLPARAPRGGLERRRLGPQRRGAGGVRLDQARRRHGADLRAQPRPADGRHRPERRQRRRPARSHREPARRSR